MYTWTEKKNRDNKKKHGLYLSEAEDVFLDPRLLEFYDAAHSSLEEDRYITIGCFHETMLLFVITTDKKTGETQIITARPAEPPEERAYNEHYQKEIGRN
jgi:uncharacterized DUF497 family protein